MFRELSDMALPSTLIGNVGFDIYCYFVVFVNEDLYFEIEAIPPHDVYILDNDD